MADNNTSLAHHFADLDQQHEADSLGMWIFLATELMVFGALFAGYSVYRSLYPAEFKAGSAALNLWFGGFNTAVLLTSSFTMAMSVHETRLNRPRMASLCLFLTALLGLAFLIIKGFEYYSDYRDNLVPGLAFDDAEWLQHDPPLQPGKVVLFLAFYYIMTGLHALHLLVGIGLITIIGVQAWRGRYNAEYYSPVEVSGLYWHFIDVIWIFLLPLLYLISLR